MAFNLTISRVKAAYEQAFESEGLSPTITQEVKDQNPDQNFDQLEQQMEKVKTAMAKWLIAVLGDGFPLEGVNPVGIKLKGGIEVIDRNSGVITHEVAPIGSRSSVPSSQGDLE